MGVGGSPEVAQQAESVDDRVDDEAEWEHVCSVDPELMSDCFPDGVVSLMPPEGDEDSPMTIDLGGLFGVSQCRLQSAQHVEGALPASLLRLTIGRVTDDMLGGLGSPHSCQSSSGGLCGGGCNPSTPRGWTQKQTRIEGERFDPPVILTGNTHEALLFAAVISRKANCVSRLSFGVWKVSLRSERMRVVREESASRTLVAREEARFAALLKRAPCFLRREAPAWTPDESSPTCPCCHTPFSLFHRRHHCRSCGQLACASCSAVQEMLSKPAHTRALADQFRVCVSCADIDAMLASREVGEEEAEA